MTSRTTGYDGARGGLAALALLAALLPGGTARAAEPAPQGPADPPGWWLVRPKDVETKLLDWARRFPELVSLDREKTLGGHTAYAVTVTGPGPDAKTRRRLVFSQPHAHEPAATAGMMDFLSQLLEGKHLDGRASDLDREKVLGRAVLTFIPLGNPDGSARAPAAWWDGKTHTNDEFLDVAFGQGRDGKRFPRQGRWSQREQSPVLLGIVYEKINDHEYVEPNRDPESTFFKLVRRALDRGCDLHVDLHQTEFIGSKHNAMVILPFMQNDLPEALQRANRRAAEAILGAWKGAGAEPIPEAKPLGYGEDQIRYFRKTWGDVYRTVPHVTVEVQNNNPRTPPAEQLRLTETAVRAAVSSLASGPLP